MLTQVFSELGQLPDINYYYTTCTSLQYTSVYGLEQGEVYIATHIVHDTKGTSSTNYT